MPHVQINRVPLYYELKGSGSMSIVFIHGMGLSHTNWIEQLPVFSKEAKVLAYDLRGHGRSGCSPCIPDEKSYIDYLVDDLKQLLDHVHMDRVFLVGYSTGCLIALKFILKYPHRVWGTALSGAFPKVSNFFLYSKLAGSLLLGELHFKNWLCNQVAKSNGATKEQIQLFQYEAKKIRWKESQQLIRSCLSFDIIHQLSAIQTPTLLIYGGNDRHMMKYRHQFLLSVPQAEISLVPKTNHACPTKGRDIFNRLVQEFINIYRPHEEITTLSTFYTNQNTSNSDQNPQDFAKGYFISDAHQSNSSRGNENKWSH